jgi:predicted Zn-dependent protease
MKKFFIKPLIQVFSSKMNSIKLIYNKNNFSITLKLMNENNKENITTEEDNKLKKYFEMSKNQILNTLLEEIKDPVLSITKEEGYAPGDIPNFIIADRTLKFKVFLI